MSFNRYGRLYYFDPGEVNPAVGDKVLVPTVDGPEVAECVWAPQWVDDAGDPPRLLGLAGPADLSRDQLLRKRKAEAKVAAKKLIREHDLPMKVVAIDHVLDPTTGPGGVAAGSGAATGGPAWAGASNGGSGPRTTIYFTAPHRVDFRSLVRDLGATLHCRVELRQLSARDSARVQGGIGSCGRDLCCATFLTDFEPVTIRMAKDQDLPLNPLRISGACGRLMCCLKYEHPLYATGSSFPVPGSRVETPDGPGRVVSRHPPSETVTVRGLEDGQLHRCALSDVCGSRQAYEQRT